MKNLHILAFRSKEGLWYLVPRTYAPKRVSKRLTVHLSVYEPSSPEEQAEHVNRDPTAPVEEKDPCFRYKGVLNPHALTDEEVLTGGQYLCVHDTQVKPLMKDRSIFEYSVSVTIAQA